MKTISYNNINASESDYLYVRTSQIINAGDGLYTVIDLYKDEMIAVFGGEILTQHEADNRVIKGLDRYFIIMPNGSVMDSMRVDCFAKFANDATGLPNSAFKNNAKIALDDDNQVGIIATRRIKAGEEIFCSYGKAYWRKHR